MDYGGRPIGKFCESRTEISGTSKAATAVQPPFEQGVCKERVLEQDQPDTEFRELMNVLRRDEREEVAEANREIMNIVKSLGGNSGRCRRERAKALRAVVSEIYSPPRVTAATKSLLRTAGPEGEITEQQIMSWVEP